ncbi:MAG: ABC transporter permease [Oscillospiraceae bacterium]
MSAIFRRELKSYFTSPIGYIFLAAFYAASAVIFSLTSLQEGSTKMDSLFAQLMIILIVLIPVLTMRTFSEEKKNRTDQCLLTAPVNLFSVVFGKFLAAFVVYVLAIAITGVYAVVVAAFSAPDWNVILGNIVGLMLLGAAFIAIGIFCSACTENQVVSAVVSFIVMLVLYLFSTIGNLIPVEFISKIFTKLSFWERYFVFTYGVFDFSNVLFFISAAAVFIFLTIRVLEKRRWA